MILSVTGLVECLQSSYFKGLNPSFLFFWDDFLTQDYVFCLWNSISSSWLDIIEFKESDLRSTAHARVLSARPICNDISYFLFFARQKRYLRSFAYQERCNGLIVFLIFLSLFLVTYSLIELTHSWRNKTAMIQVTLSCKPLFQFGWFLF